MDWAIWKERRFTETLQAGQFISSVDVELGVDDFLPACFFTAMNEIYIKRIIQVFFCTADCVDIYRQYVSVIIKFLDMIPECDLYQGMV